MSRSTKKKMAGKHKTEKNAIYWNELDKHKELVVDNITEQSMFLHDYLSDPAIAALVDSDKESTLIVKGFCKDMNHVAARLLEISEEHKDKTGKIIDHGDYVKMMNIFEEYNETALKFDHSLQTAVTEINTKIALEAAKFAKEKGDVVLHDEIINSGIIENTTNKGE